MIASVPARLTRIEHYLSVLLPLYWLRPESALWYAHEFNAVLQILGDDPAPAALEFGCLDGINTFVLLGGVFDFAFDLYGGVNVRPADDAAHDYLAGAAPPTPADIVARPRARFAYALDYLEAHLDKAAALGFYDQRIRHAFDAPLPSVADGSLSTIWAPMLFWVERARVSETLEGFRRWLAPGGRIVTMAPDTRIAEWLVRTRAAGAKAEWVDTLDRSKYQHFTRNARSRQEWEAVFASAGLAVTQHTTFAPPGVVQIYDIGLRPMFPAMAKMYDLVKRYAPDEVLDIKRHWVDVCEHYLRPMCSETLVEAGRDAATWYVFELRAAS